MDDPRSLRIAGAREIQDLIGVSRQRVYQLAKRADFPRPIARLRQGQIWRVDDVEAWVAEHRKPKATHRTAEPEGREAGTPQHRRPDPHDPRPEDWRANDD